MSCCRGVQYENSYRIVYPGSSLHLIRSDEQFWTIPVLPEPLNISVEGNEVRCEHLRVDEDTGFKMCAIRDGLEVMLATGSHTIWPRCVKDWVLNPPVFKSNES